MEYCRELPHSTGGRWHSLSHLSNHSSGASGPLQPFARSQWRFSEWDPRASLLQRMQKETALKPRGEVKELRKLETDLNMMNFELLSLRQRIESSFALLEEEITWLEMMSSRDRKLKQERKDKRFALKMKQLKAKSYSGKRRPALVTQDSSPTEALQMVSSQMTEANQSTTDPLQAGEVSPERMGELQTVYKIISLDDSVFSLQEKEQLSTHRQGLEREVNEPTPLLNRAVLNKECLLQEKDAPHRQVQDLLLDLEKQERFDAPVPTLHGDIVGATSPACHQDEEKLLLKGELESARQANQELSLEVAESRRNLEATSDRLRDLEAEKKDLQSRIQELEKESARLLAEREGRPSEGQLDRASREEELEGAAGGFETDPSRIHQYLLFSSQQLETPLLHQMELDACTEDLEQKPGRALHHHVQLLQSGSQSYTVPMPESTLQEKDTEVAWVEEELQKVWDMLKSRDTDLDSIRSQYAECSSEKQHLNLLVTSLEEQLEEKEQALRRLEGAEDEARAESERKISFLEQKLAEMEAAQDLPGLGLNTALKSQEVQKNVPGVNGRSQGMCSRCSAALAQLNRMIPSVGNQEKVEPTLACLYQLQDLLKGSVSDQAVVPTPGQSSSQDPSARVIRSPQEEKEILKQRHQLVTEELKELFRQRQEQERSKKQPRGSKEESLRRPWKSEESLAMPESTGPRDDRLRTPDILRSSKEVQRLRQQLKEKMETISSMASKIQDLQQKNESLMQAKLRFQQQIEQIRSLPKQWTGRSSAELLVLRISASLGQDSQITQGSDSSAPSPRSDKAPFTGSPEDPRKTPPSVSHHHSSDEDQRRGSSSDEGMNQTHFSGLPLAPPSPPVLTVPSLKPLSLELLSSPQVESDMALLSSQSSVLLSPRPFGPPRPWSPFKFKEHPDFPADRERH